MVNSKAWLSYLLLYITEDNCQSVASACTVQVHPLSATKPRRFVRVQLHLLGVFTSRRQSSMLMFMHYFSNEATTICQCSTTPAWCLYINVTRLKASIGGWLCPNLNGTTSSHESFSKYSVLNDVTSFPLVVYHFRFLTPTRVVSYY